MKMFGKHLMAATIVASLVAGCGGGGDSVAVTPASPALSGTAAVGFPIVSGNVTVRCAGGNNLTTTTSTAGAWTVTLSGQTFPCAVQVNGGTINGATNTTPYQSLATAAGTDNITPLTDLIFANVLGTATPGTLFGTLTTAQLAAITATQITTALTNLRNGLALTALNNVDPLGVVFNATPGVVTDDILSALRTAMTNASQTYASLLAAAGASAGGVYALPTGFKSALTTAYAGTGSGGTGGGGVGGGDAGAQTGVL